MTRATIPVVIVFASRSDAESRPRRRTPGGHDRGPNLSRRDYSHDILVKKVSSRAAIIAVPAMVTGCYGMNVPYPGSGETWGVVVSTYLMAVAGFILYRVFRRHDWL